MGDAGLAGRKETAFRLGDEENHPVRPVKKRETPGLFAVRLMIAGDEAHARRMNLPVDGGDGPPRIGQHPDRLLLRLLRGEPDARSHFILKQLKQQPVVELFDREIQPAAVQRFVNPLDGLAEIAVSRPDLPVLPDDQLHARDIPPGSGFGRQEERPLAGTPDDQPGFDEITQRLVDGGAADAVFLADFPFRRQPGLSRLLKSEQKIFSNLLVDGFDRPVPVILHDHIAVYASCLPYLTTIIMTHPGWIVKPESDFFLE